jgi:hypothetical protein
MPLTLADLYRASSGIVVHLDAFLSSQYRQGSSRTLILSSHSAYVADDHKSFTAASAGGA